MESIFQSERNNFTKPIVIVWIMMMLTLYGSSFLISKVHSLKNDLFGGIVAALIIGIAVWFVWGKYLYKITDEELLVVAGPRKWKIPVKDINFIRLNQKPAGSVVRASRSLKGIVIYYKKNFSIYISPIPQDKFIEMLRALNNKIEIREGLIK